MLPAASAPPLTLMVPAVPGVRVPRDGGQGQRVVDRQRRVGADIDNAHARAAAADFLVADGGVVRIDAAVVKVQGALRIGPGVAALAQLHRVRHYRDVAAGKIAKGGAGNLSNCRWRSQYKN